MTCGDPTLQLMERLGILEVCKAIAVHDRHISFVSATPCGGCGLTGGIMDVDRLLTAIEAVQRGRDHAAEFSANTAERRKAFLEVSSPFASLMKAMWERSDPAMQKRDRAEVMKLSIGSSQISLAGIRPRMRC